MTRGILSAIVLLAVGAAPSLAQPAVLFKKARLVDERGKKTKVDLVLDEERNEIAARVDGTKIEEVPYASITEIEYEYEDDSMLVPNLLDPDLVVMDWEFETHWLRIDYDDGGQPGKFVVQLHHSNNKDVLLSLEEQTGLTIKNLKDAKISQKYRAKRARRIAARSAN